jgi:hypothetical protein
MNAFDERVRGARARQILDDPVFQDAVMRAQDDMVTDLINIAVVASRMRRCRRCVALCVCRRYTL